MAKTKLYINNKPVSNIKAYWLSYGLDYGALRCKLYQAKIKGIVEFKYKGFNIRRVV